MKRNDKTNGLSTSEPYDPPFTHGGGGRKGGRGGDLEMQQVGHGGGGGGADDMEKFNEEVSLNDMRGSFEFWRCHLARRQDVPNE
jgi:hypothetical protein